ncbi:hypothetical protein J3E64_001167 [Sphingobium sp. OAS761]|uniref:hypothetical protein n=1 Tax=Sphingobium sp. OAS761 TaxID=2817901 RepID=UPI00209FF113|nr:hypothetical protein [Sphingobium sp. OAS761]MCP1469492.1 hypothetical protein [Sphingobium sp. OAS761]
MNQPDRKQPPRVVHLLGGLRAIDVRAEQIVVQIAPNLPVLAIKTPEYAHLYAVLSRLNLTPIGVEFPHALTMEGRMPPDWQAFFPGMGFRLMDERNAWSNIRHSASRDGEHAIRLVASKCVTYLDLLNIRLLQLSAAYSRTLRAQMFDGKKPPGFFSNGYMREVDAAVHAFLSDAGSFRDLVAEIVWRFVLMEPGQVTTLATFLKKAKGSGLLLVKEMLEAGKDGGWLHSFSELRNNIVHVAPVGRSQTFHYCEVREIAVGADGKVPALHYAVLGKDGCIWQDAGEDTDFNDEAAIKAALEQYRAYFADSIDGLGFAVQTIERMMALLTQVRAATGFKGEMMTITDADIIGEVKVTRR